MAVEWYDLGPLLNTGWYESDFAGYYIFDGKVFLEGNVDFNPASNFNPITPVIAAGALPEEHCPVSETTVKLIVDQEQASADFGGIDYYEATVAVDGSITLIPRDDPEGERELPNGFRSTGLGLGVVWWDIPAPETFPAENSVVPDFVNYDAGTDPKFLEGGGQVRGQGTIVANVDDAETVCLAPGVTPAVPANSFFSVPIVENGTDSWWRLDVISNGAIFMNQKFGQRFTFDYDPAGPDEPWIGKSYDTNSFSHTIDGVVLNGDVGITNLGANSFHEVGGSCQPLLSTQLDAVNALVIALYGRTTSSDRRFYLGRYRRNPLNAGQWRAELWEYDTNNTPAASLRAASGYTNINIPNRTQTFRPRMEYQLTPTSVWRVRFFYSGSSVLSYVDPTPIGTDGEVGWLKSGNGSDWGAKWVQGMPQPYGTFHYPLEGMEFDLSQSWWRGGRELGNFMMVV